MTDDRHEQTRPRRAADVTHPGGMRAERVFPTDAQSHLDPFVVFERFHIEPDQGFPTHPHRGFEIVSYLLDGEMVHEDSMGHASTASAGDAMWITTGSGMEHSELPGEGGCNGLQLWVDLPREHKDADPSFRAAGSDDLPTRETDGATVTTVVGEEAPLDLHTPVEYRVAAVDDAWQWDVPDGWNGFLFVVSGAGKIAGSGVEAADFVVVDGGGTIRVSAESGVEVACLAGAPHGEPIRQRGPFVA